MNRLILDDAKMGALIGRGLGLWSLEIFSFFSTLVAAWFLEAWLDVLSAGSWMHVALLIETWCVALCS